MRSTQMTSLTLLLAALAAPMLMGASTCNLRGLDNLPQASKKRTYAENAKFFYEQAEKESKGGNYDQARKIFRQIKTSYPFSQYASLAEIGIADTFFQEGKFLQAADLYSIFVKLHPSHTKHPYALFQIAQCHFKRRPWDWFLVPPSYEKDSTTTRLAIKAFESFLRQYPHDKHAKEANENLRVCLQQLAQHEIYAAQFYAERGKYQAVVWRMQYLLKKYPLANYNAEARLRMAKAYLQLKDPHKAKDTLKMLLQKDPKSKEASEAQKTLALADQAIAALEKGKKLAGLRTAAAEKKEIPAFPNAAAKSPATPTPPAPPAASPSKATTPSL